MGARPDLPQRVHRDIADVRRRQPPGLQGESTRDRGSSHKILNLICTTFDCRAAWLGLRVGSRRYGAGVQSLMFPSINLEGALSQLGADTFRRGVAYAREGRVIRCLWDPDACSLLGNVRGSRGRTYTTTVQLSEEATDNWTVQLGLCSCPMQADCKHVAAIVVAAAGVTKTRGQRTPTAPSPPAWRQSLDALLPASSTNDAVTTPLAIELSLSQAGHSPTLDARLVRPGKRGGWVAGDLSWARVDMLRHLRISRRPSSAAAGVLCNLSSVEFDWLLQLFIRRLFVRGREDNLAAAVRVAAVVAAAGRGAPGRGAAGAAAGAARCAGVCRRTDVPRRHGRRCGRSFPSHQRFGSTAHRHCR